MNRAAREARSETETRVAKSISASYESRTRGARFRVWLRNRMLNDREPDHGLLMIGIGLWFFLFSAKLGEAGWWHEVFSVMPPWLWAGALCGLGLIRFTALLGLPRPWLANAALAASALFAALAALVALIQFRMVIFPVLVWSTWQATKSAVRLFWPRGEA